MNRNLLIGLVLLLTAILVWVGLFWDPHDSAPDISLQPPKGGDFVLNSAAGTVDLKSMRGEVVVLFFGYTMCPDVCPTSMGLLSSAFNGLSLDEQKQVRGLFISVDPERDTPERLKTYGAYFHDRIQGVTGSEEQLADVAKMYGAAFRKSGEASGSEYLMDHSADLYVIDRQGRLHTSVRHGTPPRELMQLLKQLLNKES